MIARHFLRLAVFLAFAGTPALADSITFTFTFNAAGAGIAGQSGSLAVSVRSNVASPLTTATYSSFSIPAPGVLGAVITQTCTVTGSLSTQLGLTALDNSLPGFQSCVHNQAVSTFPNTLSIVGTANFVTGLPVELELSIGNTNNFFVGAAIGYFNTDGNGNNLTGFVVIPGAVNLFANSNFTVTQSANPVPEPASVLLVASGLTAGWLRRRRKT